MKKFFVALMAVLVLASCAEKKTPADVLGMTTEIMSVTAEKINNAKSADDVIAALQAMQVDIDRLDENYDDLMEGLDEEKLAEMYPAEIEALSEATTAWAMSLFTITAEIEFTPEQELQISEIFEELDM